MMTSNYAAISQDMQHLVDKYGPPVSLQRTINRDRNQIWLSVCFGAGDTVSVDIDLIPAEWHQQMLWKRGFSWDWKEVAPWLKRRIWCLRDWGIGPAIAATLVAEHYDREG